MPFPPRNLPQHVSAELSSPLSDSTLFFWALSAMLLINYIQFTSMLYEENGSYVHTVLQAQLHEQNRQSKTNCRTNKKNVLRVSAHSPDSRSQNHAVFNLEPHRT